MAIDRTTIQVLVFHHSLRKLSSPQHLPFLEEPDSTFVLLALYFSWWIGKYRTINTSPCIFPFPKKTSCRWILHTYPERKLSCQLFLFMVDGKVRNNSIHPCILPFAKKKLASCGYLYFSWKLWYHFNHFYYGFLFAVITVTYCLFLINLIQFRLYSSSLFHNILVLNKPFIDPST